MNCSSNIKCILIFGSREMSDKYPVLQSEAKREVCFCYHFIYTSFQFYCFSVFVLQTSPSDFFNTLSEHTDAAAICGIVYGKEKKMKLYIGL